MKISRLAFLLLFLVVNLICTAQINEIWGLALKGGQNRMGGIFKTDTLGENYSLEYSVPVDFDHNLLLMCEDHSGNVYGISRNYHLNRHGGLIKIDTFTKQYTTVHHFDGPPSYRILCAENGKLYGLIRNSDNYGPGKVYEFDPNTNQYTELLQFSSTEDVGRNIIDIGNGEILTYATVDVNGYTRFRKIDCNTGAVGLYNLYLGTHNKEFPATRMILSHDSLVYFLSHDEILDSLFVIKLDPFTMNFTKSKGIYNYHNYTFYETNQVDSSRICFIRNSDVVYYDMDNESFLSNTFDTLSNLPDFIGNISFFEKNISTGCADIYGYSQDSLYIYNILLDSVIAKWSNQYNGLSLQSIFKNSLEEYYVSAFNSDDSGCIFKLNTNSDSVRRFVDFERTIVLLENTLLFHSPTTSLYLNTEDALFEYDHLNSKLNELVRLDSGSSFGKIKEGSNGKYYGIIDKYSQQFEYFEFDPFDNSFSIVYEDKYKKYVDLFLSKDGTLYQFSEQGANNGNGYISKYNELDSSFLVLYDFQYSVNITEVFEDSIGVFYILDKMGHLSRFSSQQLQIDTLFRPINSNGVCAFNSNIIDGEIFIVQKKNFNTWFQLRSYNIYSDSMRMLSNLHNISIPFHNDKVYSVDISDSIIVFSKFYRENLVYKTHLFSYNIFLDSVRLIKDLNWIEGVNLTDLTKTSFCYPTAAEVFTNSCDSFYSQNNSWYYSDQTIIDTLVNAIGCDSILTTHMRLNFSAFDSISITECNHYISPSGQYLTTAGVYYDTLQTSHGCDSVIKIDLSFNDLSTTNLITENSCITYISPSGKTYSSSGIYFDTIGNSQGCDSIITIVLSIQDSINKQILLSDGGLQGVALNSSYQWFNCDSNSVINGADSSYFKPDYRGYFSLIVNDGVCIDTSACILFVRSESDIVLEDINPHPNPTKDFVIIEEDDITEIVVYDLTGKVLKQIEVAETPIKIDLSAYSNGIYVLQIKSKTKVFEKRIVLL
jgi:hypothetical protein